MGVAQHCIVVLIYISQLTHMAELLIMLIDHCSILFCEVSNSFVYFPMGPALFFSFILKSSLYILDVYQFEGEI